MMSSAVPRPVSPAGHAELKRSNAARSQRRGDEGEEGRGRSRSPTRRPQPASPGKENVALSMSASPTRQAADASSAGQTYKLGVPLRNVSPERKAVVVQESSRKTSERRERERSASRSRTTADDVLPRSREEINHDFHNMLSEMEVPATLRAKLLAMDPKVKESMVKGKETLSLASLHAATGSGGSGRKSSKSRPAISDRLKKSKSSTNLNDETTEEDQSDLMPPPPRKTSFFGGGPASRQTSGSSQTSQSSPTEGCDPKKKRSSSDKMTATSNQNHGSSVFLPLGGASRSRASSFSSAHSAAAGGGGPNTMTATAYATMLKTTAASHLDVAKLKRMRAVLSSESPSWMAEFIEQGGYAAMLARLQELVDMEWREEQHDDQALHELLRCFVALPTTDRGKAALQSSMPSPFGELNDLLCSEKRPGDLTTRKHLVEILLLLADLPWATSVSSKELLDVLEKREKSSTLQAIQSASPPAPANITLLLCLMHSPRDPSKENIVDFVKSSHTPRPFKVFVNELYDIARNYYWAFTHGGNRFWALADLDARAIESPQVPSGMTGGIENEAMHYLTTKLRLLNKVSSQVSRLARKQQQSLDVDFHRLLFSSGIDRVLGALRQASQHYYPFLHLELSRYLNYARRTGFRIPIEIEYWQNASRKESPSKGARHGGQDSLPASHSGTPSLSLAADTFSSPDDAFSMGSMLEQVTGDSRDRPQKQPMVPTQASSSRPNSPVKAASAPNPATTPAAGPSKSNEVASNTGKWLVGGKAPASPKRTTAPAGKFFQPPRNPGSAPSSPARSPAPDADPTRTSPSKRQATDAGLLQERMPNPHAARTTPAASPNMAELSGPAVPSKSVAQDSVVMTAIRKWEQLAQDGGRDGANKQGGVSVGGAGNSAAGQQQGLGLGWAPTRSRQA